MECFGALVTSEMYCIGALPLVLRGTGMITRFIYIENTSISVCIVEGFFERKDAQFEKKPFVFMKYSQKMIVI